MLLLIGGALINVAVAWGCAAYAPMWPFASDTDHSPFRIARWGDNREAWWSHSYPFHAPDEREEGHWVFPDRDRTVSVPGFQLWMLEGHFDEGLAESVAARAIAVESGLPAKSMSGERWSWVRVADVSCTFYPLTDIATRGVRSFSIEAKALSQNGSITSMLMSDRRILPLRPLWFGFVFNTLFYALLLGLVCLGPWQARRLIRRRRRQCERCAYPIGTSPRCTECGCSVRRPRLPAAAYPSSTRSAL